MKRAVLTVAVVCALALVPSLALAADTVDITAVITHMSSGTTTTEVIRGLRDGETYYLPIDALFKVLGVEVPYRVSKDGSKILYPVGYATQTSAILKSGDVVHVDTKDFALRLGIQYGQDYARDTVSIAPWL